MTGQSPKRNDGRSAAIVFLAGKKPRSGTIFDLLISRLSAEKLQITVELPHDHAIRPEDWPEHALIVHRGLSRQTLQQMAGFQVEARAFCNPIGSSVTAGDRRVLLSCLQSSRLPVPTFTSCADWPSVLAAASGQNIVIKATDGARGRGSEILFSQAEPLPSDQPFAGPFLLENRIVRQGDDRKLYVAGSRCFGLLKPWPRTADDPGVPFHPSDQLRRLALAVGQAAGLEIYGVDFVIGSDGPVIVDVNVFPGFRGVDGGGEAVLDHVRWRAHGTARATRG